MEYQSQNIDDITHFKTLIKEFFFNNNRNILTEIFEMIKEKAPIDGKIMSYINDTEELFMTKEGMLCITDDMADESEEDNCAAINNHFINLPVELCWTAVMEFQFAIAQKIANLNESSSIISICFEDLVNRACLMQINDSRFNFLVKISLFESDHHMSEYIKEAIEKNNEKHLRYLFKWINILRLEDQPNYFADINILKKYFQLLILTGNKKMIREFIENEIGLNLEYETNFVRCFPFESALKRMLEIKKDMSESFIDNLWWNPKTMTDTSLQCTCLVQNKDIGADIALMLLQKGTQLYDIDLLFACVMQNIPVFEVFINHLILKKQITSTGVLLNEWLSPISNVWPKAIKIVERYINSEIKN